MAFLNKSKLSSQIRSAKPAVQPDRTFVDALQLQLQNQAHGLSQQVVQATPAKPMRLWFGSLGLGAVALTMLAVIISPSWFTDQVPLQGHIQKGPFISGSSITIQELDDRLQPTGTSYQVTTASDFGDYRLSQEINSDYVEVIAQGYYFDEVQGELSSAPLTLRAIADVSKTDVINVNVLTTLTVPRLRHIIVADNTDFATAKAIAEQEVLNIFQINGMVGSNFENMDISTSGDNNAILLAVSVLLQGHLSVAELSELLSKLSLGIKTDGQLVANSPLLATIQANANALNTSQIIDNLEQRYDDLGAQVTVPDFVPLLTPFATNADAFAYRLSLKDNTFGVNHTPDATIKITIYGEDFVEGQEEVSLKNTVTATSVTYVDAKTLIAELPIETLSPGSYTVQVQNTTTDRTGVTDGPPLELAARDAATTRLILRGYTPKITKVSSNVSYLDGGTITVTGQNFAFGTFVWINGWQVPQQAIRVANEKRIDIDLSPALIANNAALPRRTDLTITIQTPDFQTAEYTGFQIQ